jgi:hypothetical protein
VRSWSSLCTTLWLPWTSLIIHAQQKWNAIRCHE